jgi:peptide/nickel transport system permease protein
MWAYVLRRLLLMVPVLVLVSMIAFSILLLLPGDPALAILGPERARDTVAYQALREELGLNRSIPVQYLSWVSRMIVGDFGNSSHYQQPVIALVGQSIWPTVQLASTALVIALLIAIPIGIMSAVRPGSWLDLVGTTIALSGVAIPNFLLGILMVMLFALVLRWLPSGGYVPFSQGPVQSIRLMLMPAVALGMGLAAVLMRQIRSAMLEVMSQDYVTTARAKGLAGRNVVLRHALKNALIPVNAPQLQCATRDQHPQTYAGNQGGIRYLVRREKHRLHGVLVKSADAVNPSNDVLDAIIQHAGVNADDVVSLSAIAPQSAYTPVIQTMKQSSANFASTGLAAASMISLRQEARIQGLDDPATVWLCTAACYERSFLDAGDAVEGTYVPIGFLPFDETKASRAVAEYVRAVGRDKVSGLGVYAYAATLALREVLERIVSTHGVNGITRAAVLDGLQDLTDFDAGGLVGRTDIAGKQVTSCFVLTQVRGGRFVRVHPKKPATFDCTPSNRVNVEGDFIK